MSFRTVARAPASVVRNPLVATLKADSSQARNDGVGTYACSLRRLPADLRAGIIFLWLLDMDSLLE
jgi:hypothetical protein